MQVAPLRPPTELAAITSGMDKPPPSTAKIPSVSVMRVADASTSLARDLTDMLQIAPAAAATSLLLMIFDAIEGVHTHKSECLRLTRRCARFMLDLNATMTGHWHNAPPTLVENFHKLEGTLTDIHQFIQQQTTLKWHSRMLLKRELDKQLADYTAQLEDALASFQATSLIHIHYMLSKRQEGFQEETDTEPPAEDEDTIKTPDTSTGTSNCDDSVTKDSGIALHSPVAPIASATCPCEGLHDDSREEESGPQALKLQAEGVSKYPASRYTSSGVEMALEAEEATTFELEDSLLSRYRRCHQAALKITGRSRIKQGWWGSTVEVDFAGRSMLLKRYESAQEMPQKTWEHDVRFLSGVVNPVFPRIGAISEHASSTPFILIEDAVETRTLSAVLRDRQRKSSLSTIVLSIYEDLLRACEEVQRVFGTSDAQVCDFLRKSDIRITRHEKAIIGPSSLTALEPILSDAQVGASVPSAVTLLSTIHQTLLSASSSSDDAAQEQSRRVIDHIHDLLAEQGQQFGDMEDLALEQIEN